MSKFDGYRVYNGCPDSTMQKRLDAEKVEVDRLMLELKKYRPNVSITFFPAPPSGYIVFSNHKMIASSDPIESKIDALAYALKYIKKEI